MLLAILALATASLVISWLLTALMIRLAPRIGFVDRPGQHKTHVKPMPLGGGVAVFLAFALPMLAIILGVNSGLLGSQMSIDAAYLGGVKRQTPLALTLLVMMLVMHTMGLIDDRRGLGPYAKLVIQLAAAAVIVVPFRDVRALSNLGTAASIILTIVWIVGITNAFNFLDNMDGLSAGVAAVCATSFLITTILIEQWFVAASLALLLGALVGFLFWNFPPAKIFMGDSGSLVIGFVLGVLTIRTTYLPPDRNLGAGWYSVFAPVIVLALPLYDLIVVSIIRLARGRSPFLGDTNHFSHRLVARGMSRRTAVLCLYLITAATAMAAILLPYVRTPFGAMLIFIQTLLVLGVVALLEQHPLPVVPNNSDQQREG
jgi:UDP-GlcNAc:undecaprenyl-phosphate GlcNAc-1-phosphate transferase